MCLLNVIFLCLAGVANGVRQDRSVRDRAVTAMESMTPRGQRLSRAELNGVSDTAESHSTMSMTSLSLTPPCQ